MRVAALVALAACGAPEAPAPAPTPRPPVTAAPSDAAPPVPRAVWHRLPGVDILESAGYGSHMHGGPPAQIDYAPLRVEVTDDRVHTIEVTRIEELSASCRSTTWTERKPLKVTGYELYRDDAEDPSARGKRDLALPARRGSYWIKVGVEAFPVYQACDRTAFAIDLRVDGKPVSMEVPLHVKRYEPLRH